jgi:hypothetical protein
MERIWIYQSSRELTADEAILILKRLEEFTEGWKAHGKQLAARAEIRHNRFVIIFLNEQVAAATGCSIDKSVHLLKAIEKELGIDLFDRMRIAYRKGDSIVDVSRAGFEQAIEAGEVDENTIVFDNTVQTSGELDTRWEVPAKESWHARVFQLSV